jgi:hypothetical protein
MTKVVNRDGTGTTKSHSFSCDNCSAVVHLNNNEHLPRPWREFMLPSVDGSFHACSFRCETDIRGRGGARTS